MGRRTRAACRGVVGRVAIRRFLRTCTMMQLYHRADGRQHRNIDRLGASTAAPHHVGTRFLDTFPKNA